MLVNLHVKNMALIKEINIDFKKGLNIITGETGAGKSLLLGSVNLALGGKFSKDMLRQGADSALVELEFLVEDEGARCALEALGYPPEDGVLIITRIISEGRAGARINGRACTGSVLKSAAGILINVHGQRENQTLLKEGSQLALIDSFGKKQLGTLPDEVKKSYNAYKAAAETLNEFFIDEEKRLRETAMLKYEIQEIEAAGLKEGEEEELERRYRRMSNAGKIIEALNAAHECTGYDGGAGELIGRAIKQVASLSDKDEEIESISASLSDIEAILNDVNRQTAAYLEEFSFSRGEMDEVESRLDKIRSIQAKYGSTVKKTAEYLENAQERLERLENYEAGRKKAEADFKSAESNLDAICEKLSEKRRAAAKQLSAELSKELKELNFRQALIDVEFKRASGYRQNGYDDVEIMLSTNPGEPVRPLAKIVSGGELSRIMLAIKNLIADEENTGTLIFDEIDAGISGRTAQRVSEKMAQVAINHQVLCVTHLAQIAAMADEHFVIEKTASDNKTVTSVRALDDKARTEELARILGGAVITEAAIANAREMKAQAAEYKKALTGR